MNSSQNTASSMFGMADFDLVRARLENDVPRPAVIAITSSTSEDGKEVAARGLAYSLATSGYKTIFIDASLGSASSGKSVYRLEQEIARQLALNSGTDHLVELALGDPALQQRNSQRSIQAALEMLRGKFDYVVVNTENGASTSFATSVVATADAVLVTVKKGRRETAADGRLALALGRPGVRFLGVLALEASVTKTDRSAMVSPNVGSEVRHRKSGFIDIEKEYVRREVAEHAT